MTLLFLAVLALFFLAVVPFLRGRPLRARGLLFGGASSPDQLEPESYVCVYELEGWSKHVKIITNLCFFCGDSEVINNFLCAAYLFVKGSYGTLHVGLYGAWSWESRSPVGRPCSSKHAIQIFFVPSSIDSIHRLWKTCPHPGQV